MRIRFSIRRISDWGDDARPSWPRLLYECIICARPAVTMQLSRVRAHAAILFYPRVDTAPTPIPYRKRATESGDFVISFHSWTTSRRYKVVIGMDTRVTTAGA